ncbi:hypothetical protein HMP09_0947 [Sphingomonas sp. HMP9]|nr:hypothetical protein HMP09_0947 [Sphingomonas sp. HMP9]
MLSGGVVNVGKPRIGKATTPWTLPRIGLIVPWMGVTMPFTTGRNMSVTTDRGRLTPEHAPTMLGGGATCAVADCAANSDVVANPISETPFRKLRRARTWVGDFTAGHAAMALAPNGVTASRSCGRTNALDIKQPPLTTATAVRTFHIAKF